MSGGSYSLVLPAAHEERRGVVPRSALDLDVIAWCLLPPTIRIEVALLDEKGGQHTRHVVIDNVGRLSSAPMAQASVLGVDIHVCPNCALPILKTELI